ncbi:hypothetical protein KDW_17710 [Dictyobacter vulcani]|uniref:DUF4097 domain-containing protein n=1 Tax=Dictyobacter vulcani TaxID=2607529 RepID=A0A5J4KN96_9CHLR|nr:DUF4097 family beta strand repeat-containing protein [Dictyobacter vulcani]GER87609.1 hypothetical protein KDW_17710 [Dictyobacter vulcani]
MQSEQSRYPQQNSYPRQVGYDYEPQPKDEPPPGPFAPYNYTEPRQNYRATARRSRWRRPKYLWVFICMLVLLAVGGLINGQLSSTSSSQPLAVHTAVVTGKSSLHVRNTHGYVHIHPGNTNTIVVTPTKHTPAVGAFADNLNVSYDQNGNDNTVHVDGSSASFFFSSASIDLDISVPASSALDIYNASGPIVLTNLSGQISAETGSGDIQATHLQGSIALKTGSGDIQTNTLNGTADIQSGSGNLMLQNAQLQGNSVLHTGSGNIHFNGGFATSGIYKLDSGSGDIELFVPADADLMLTTHTVSGNNIQNDFNTDSIGKSPQAPVAVITGSGAIHVHKQ